ncbi:5-formyltetrahydrofolate cyclo-ligase [Desulfonatronum sp. SC1]|uniref:5-formyltetrahydrofolate cyclo-ligase n=1 Tax=Desulfonatronum sp. SC1 TaxID=2109626 RepID=UPI000D3010B7|nr:5-formyltetrahydrofolate cyclo-ligase [Desulfonatronum sp. SC1]PTN35995.1 5-formyltetrahydrofolate cyclo-ligase [Desulfonatronum sp. SC1]
MDKAALRRGLRVRREASAAAPAVHELIHHQVRGLPEWARILGGSRTVLVYLPLPGEVDTWPLIRELWGRGARTLAPCCCPERSGEMDFLEFQSADELVPGRYDILEPDRQICRLCAPRDADAVLVPALAFDRDGYRLGFGGGYYDRLLSRLDPHILAIGLTFHDTLLDRLPREAHDQPVRVVCTERETIRPQR